MGIRFSTDSAVSVRGDAVLHVGDIAVNIDLESVSAPGVVDWATSLQKPLFDIFHSFKPFIRNTSSVDFGVLGK